MPRLEIPARRSPRRCSQHSFKYLFGYRLIAERPHGPATVDGFIHIHVLSSSHSLHGGQRRHEGDHRIRRADRAGLWYCPNSPTCLRRPTSKCCRHSPACAVRSHSGGGRRAADGGRHRGVRGVRTGRRDQRARRRGPRRESAAATHGPEGIRVNALAPGATATEMIRTWEEGSPGLRERLTAHTPLRRRTADPQEIAQAAAWLLSDRSSYVTGTVLRVDASARARASADGRRTPPRHDRQPGITRPARCPGPSLTWS